MNKNDEEYENGRNDRINQEYIIKQKGMIEWIKKWFIDDYAVDVTTITWNKVI